MPNQKTTDSLKVKTTMFRLQMLFSSWVGDIVSLRQIESQAGLTNTRLYKSVWGEKSPSGEVKYKYISDSECDKVLEVLEKLQKKINEVTNRAMF
jgi:hypothetical protein